MRSPIVILLLCSVVGSRARLEEQDNLCAHDDCICLSESHPSWVTVNCTVPSNKKITIRPQDLPQVTSDLVVAGSEALTLDPHSLSGLGDVRQIFLRKNKAITIKTSTAVGLNIVSLFMKIDTCDVLKIEERAFSKIKGPLSIEIKNCQSVSLEGEAFSWLLMMNISNVGELKLSDSTFTLDPSAGNVGEHGPGMSIDLSNLHVAEFPSRTFGSSAASIIMRAIAVGTIRPGAFSANTYNTVMALNCSITYIEAEAFAQKSLINSLKIYGCNINVLAPEAMRSAVAKMNITGSKFHNIYTGAINATVVSVTILDNEFHTFKEKGFILSSWSKIVMRNNKFDVLSRDAILGPGGSANELVFINNEIEDINPGSLGFIGTAYHRYPFNIWYKQNYFGHQCYCNITTRLADAMRVESSEFFDDESLCTVDGFFAMCFNVPQGNIRVEKFAKKICTNEPTITCEETLSKTLGAVFPVVKNPRFPHKPKKQEEVLGERDQKVIGIVIVSALGCVLIVMLISLIRWMRKRGHCLNLKNALISSNTSCGTICDKMTLCRRHSNENIRSRSQLSVVEFSEQQRLNEPRIQEPVPNLSIPNNAEETAIMIDKITQTLPEELTRELLENLKVKLEDPENYVEARELIEHLYELIRYEDKCNAKIQHEKERKAMENIYELPCQNTTPRVGKNKKEMVSVGTKTPSLENLLPLSPYNRRTALAREYFEPKDFAVHLYAEIINYDKEKKTMLGAIPDVVAEPGMPRGPYLRAVRDKLSYSATNSPTGKMFNRPLPQKPASQEFGEGSSARSG